MSVDYELVWNRDSADGKTTLDLMKCDEDVIASKELSGQLVVWACLSSLCANDPLPTMQYRCTAFSEQEQYSLGGRSVKLDFDLDSVYHFGYVLCLSVCLSVSLSLCPVFLCLSVSVRPSVCLSVCMYVCI